MDPKFIAWLNKNGYDVEALEKPEGATMRGHLEAAWKAELATSERPSLNPSFDEKMAAIDAENDRVCSIQELTARAAESHIGNAEKVRQLRELCRTAIDDKKVSVRDFELSLLRLDRTAGPLVYAPQSPHMSNDIIEAAVCQMGKLTSLEEQFDERTLSMADKKFRHGIGLHELIALGASQNGWRGHSVRRDIRGAMRAAFNGNNGDMLASVGGPSTISVSGILSNVANKFLLDSWNAVEQAWRRITAIRSVSDFKTITSYSLTGDLTYEQVAPGGKLKHGTLGEESYTNKADTYGKLIGIDRRDVINDDLGAFVSVGKRLGRGGALKLNDVFWTEFLAGQGTFYASGNGNYDDGVDTAFGADGLTAADVIWQAKTDPDGKPLGLMAKLLLLPPGHRIAGLRLMRSQRVTEDSADGDENPWAGMFEVVSSVYLANSSYTGYSALAWYMLADPNELPAIETVFLNGVEMPTVEEVEMAADQLGMAMRAYHDFGVRKQEKRAVLKLKGEA